MSVRFGCCARAASGFGQVWIGGMSFSSSRELVGIGGIARLRDVGAHVPELAEVAAALVGRIVVPQELARHLVISPTM